MLNKEIIMIFLFCMCGLCYANEAEKIEMLDERVSGNVSPKLYIDFNDKLFRSEDDNERYYIIVSLNNYSGDTLFCKSELGEDSAFILSEGYAFQGYSPKVVFPSIDKYIMLNACDSLDDPSRYYEKIYIPFDKKTLLSYKGLELCVHILVYNVSDKREVQYEQEFFFEFGKIDERDASIPIKVAVYGNKSEDAVYGNKSEDQIRTEDNQ